MSDKVMNKNALKRVSKSFMVIGIVAGLSACASYPLNMSKAEWESLPAEAKLTARQEQAALDKARSEERKAAHEAREREAYAQEAAYRQVLSSAPYGDRVQCLMEGDAYIAGEWRRLDTSLFELIPDYPISVPLRTLDGRYQTDGSAEFNGYRVSLCDRQHGLLRRPERCGVMSGTRLQFARGNSVNVQADQFLRGYMYCEFSR
jgi:hypothetical protein